jgi:invasion protein IalB
MTSNGIRAALAAALLCAAPGWGIAQDDAADADGTGAETAAEASAAPPRVANGSRVGAWTVTCEAIAVGETACVLTQRLVRTSDNAFLAELLAFRSADGARTFLAARVPNGVFFPSGFAVRAGDEGEQREFSWQSCSRDLCEALLEVDAEVLAELEEAETLLAGYRPGLQADPLVFRFSAAGAADGLSALDAAAGR